jgi:hypothetical protein
MKPQFAKVHQKQAMLTVTMAKALGCTICQSSATWDLVAGSPEYETRVIDESGNIPFVS